MNQVEKTIAKIDSYLKLVRYKYTELEKLSRLNILFDYYSSKELMPSDESLLSNIEYPDMLSKEITLPLKVHGIFLSEGKPKHKYYSSDELEKSTKNPINQSFPLMLDHRANEVGKIIGKVDRIEYDPKIKALRWYGHINNETFARNVLDGVITQVSASIYSTTVIDRENGVSGKDLVFKELSLVMAGAEPQNSIFVD